PLWNVARVTATALVNDPPAGTMAAAARPWRVIVMVSLPRKPALLVPLTVMMVAWPASGISAINHMVAATGKVPDAPPLVRQVIVPTTAGLAVPPSVTAVAPDGTVTARFVISTTGALLEAV